MPHPIVVVGGGGHARVVADILAESHAFEIAGYVCPDGPHRIPGANRLGDDSVLPRLHEQGIVHAAVALGDNGLRKRICAELLDRGFALPLIVHPSAVVSRHAELGDGTVVMPAAVINTGTRVGRGVIVNTGATIDHDCRIGDFAHIAPGCHLAGSVTVGEGVFLGVGTSVIPDRCIGAWSTVGAGAAVVGDLPESARAMGVPARVREKPAS